MMSSIAPSGHPGAIVFAVPKPVLGRARIHGQLLKLGIDVSQTTVVKYMAKGKRPPSRAR